MSKVIHPRSISALTDERWTSSVVVKVGMDPLLDDDSVEVVVSDAELVGFPSCSCSGEGNMSLSGQQWYGSMSKCAEVTAR